MIRADTLSRRLAHILAARGKSADFARDCICADDSDGLLPRLAYWNEALLGPTPTQAEVDAASDRPTKDQQNAPILAELAANDQKVIRALVEGDIARIDAHKVSQAALRKRLL